MRIWTSWDYLQLIAAVASIIGTAFALFDATLGPWRYVIGGLIITCVLLAALPNLFRSKQTLTPVPREAIIGIGQRLLQVAKSEIILFGGDLSWAEDYAGHIIAATNNGTRVMVVYPRADAKATRVEHNAKILQEAGAKLACTETDSGLRGWLVDPKDPRDAVLFIVERSLKVGALPSETGEHGSTVKYEYLGKIYTTHQDWLMIRTVSKIYQMLMQGP